MLVYKASLTAHRSRKMSAKGQVRNVISKLNQLEKSLRNKVESGALLNEAKRFADSKSKILRQRVKTNKDLKKIVNIVEQRRRQFEKVAKDLPREVQNVRSYIKSQRKELERIGDRLWKVVNQKAPATVSGPKRKTSTKKAARSTKKRA